MKNQLGRTIIQKKRKQKKKEKLLLWSISILLIASILISGGFLAWHLLQKEEHVQAEEQTKFMAYQAKETIERGQVITLEMLEEVELTPVMPSDYYFTKSSAGKTAVVTISAGMVLLSNMCQASEIELNQREIECDIISLNENLTENDYVDIRLMLPNGEDYIVMAKKSVHGLSRQEGESLTKCYLWMNEEEILHYSAAIVDSYLYTGASMYTAKYIEPSIQEASYVTYLPSLSTLELMRQDPNLVERAKQALRENERKSLENRLADYLNQDVREILWNGIENVSQETNQSNQTSETDNLSQDEKLTQEESSDFSKEETPKESASQNIIDNDYFTLDPEQDGVRKEEP